jgi:hypothetical protein
MVFAVDADADAVVVVAVLAAYEVQPPQDPIRSPR